MRVTEQWILVARHFETEKNVHGIHGSSCLDRLTSLGSRQAERLAARIIGGRLDVKGVVATPTAQAQRSAEVLAKLLSVPYQGLLSLKPFDLGRANGISTQTLRETDRGSFESLDRFRARVVDARLLQVADAEEAANLGARLETWWNGEGSVRCLQRVTMGSSSTVLMLSHLLDGNPPSSGRYRFLGTPNGSMRMWQRSSSEGRWQADSRSQDRSWPEIELRQVCSPGGRVASTWFMPGWDVRRTAVVVVPGYFGSSRQGPYGLYTKLAREWSFAGFLTVTIDPLGSGESSPVDRTFQSEVQSAVTVGNLLMRECERVLFVGHSMGAATALAAASFFPGKASVWCLAPLCTIEEFGFTFLSGDQLSLLRDTGATMRHGLELRLDVIQSAENAWWELSHTADTIILAEKDQYVKSTTFPQLESTRILRVPNADHNFSGNDSFPRLLEMTADLMFLQP